MGELNFGRILARAPVFGDGLAVHDLGTGHSSTYLEHLDRVGHFSTGFSTSTRTCRSSSPTA